ncbi:hypothetical protein CEXT_166561 [Caerostris extrusa]|uniref:Ycf15 n=1 Tax=Caerostris extrusa TaxID=172846 RepID=A0AAV4T2Y3_CAEEX|nr:hypothetical protein CEXT_166561 [Caerostris extrusa]
MFHTTLFNIPFHIPSINFNSHFNQTHRGGQGRFAYLEGDTFVLFQVQQTPLSPSSLSDDILSNKRTLPFYGRRQHPSREEY